jgi:hypothetical protein
VKWGAENDTAGGAVAEKPSKTEELQNRQTAKLMIVEGKWEIDGKSARLQLATPDIARMVVSEIAKQVNRYMPQVDERDGIITVTVKKNVLETAQKALSREVKI